MLLKPKSVGSSTLCVLLLTVSFLVSLPRLSDADEIKVSGPEFPPFIISTEMGPEGIVVDLVRMALKEAGHTARFDISNFARAFALAQNHKTDGLIPAMKSDDRVKFLHYPDMPLVNLEMVFITAKGSGVTYDGTVESLKDYRISWLRKGRVSPEFDRARKEGRITVEERDSFELSLKAAAKGRVHLATGDKHLALWTARKLGILDEIEILEPPLASVPVYLAISKERHPPALASQVSDILKRFHEDGTYDKIMGKYIGPAS